MFGKTEELILILVIILVLFGARKLPELSRSIGQSMKEIRRGFSDDDKDEDKHTTKTHAEAEKSS